MEIIHSKQSQNYIEELQWTIAAEAQKELQQLNQDYLIGWSQTGNIPNADETIKLGNLPPQVQEGILKGLESSARGELSRWEFS